MPKKPIAPVERQDMDLVVEAIEARKYAYAPYSNFKVGVALESKDRRVFRGANVENASYGVTECAERVAVYKAVSEGAREFRRIAIVTGTKNPTPPCGSCQQVIREFDREGKCNIILATFNPDLPADPPKIVATYRLKDLSPVAFTASNIEPEPKNKP